MSNINLYQAESEKADALKKKSVLGAGFFFPLFVFILVLIVAGAAKILHVEFQNKSASLNEELQNETSEFSDGGTDVKRVFDFNSRVEAAAANVVSKPEEMEVYASIEEYLMPSIRAKEIAYTDDGEVVHTVLNLEAVKFVDIATQVASFKEMVDKYAEITDKDIFKDRKTVFLLPAGVALEDVSREQKTISFKIKVDFIKKFPKE